MKHGLPSTSPAADTVQLDLLSLYTLQPGQSRWSRHIDVYDVISKFFNTKNKKTPLEQPAPAIRTYPLTIMGEPCTVVITPALISFRNAKKKGFYAFPGEREELVSRAIRYLAVQGHSSTTIQHDTNPRASSVSQTFTLGQVQVLLADLGHTFSKSEIAEAIQILHKTNLQVEFAHHKDRNINNHLIESYDSDGDKRRVKLNPYESRQILDGQYRLLNFQRLMALEDPLARRLYEVIMTEHRGARRPPREPGNKPEAPYILRLSSAVLLLGMEPEGRIRRTVDRIRQALQTMKDKQVFWLHNPYTEEIQWQSTGGRRRIQDVVWRLHLSNEEVGYIIDGLDEAKAFSPDYKSLPGSTAAQLRQATKRNIK